MWYLGCTGKSSEDLDSEAGEVGGVSEHHGHQAALHLSWQAGPALFLLQDVLQQLKESALPSFPWALISELAMLSGLALGCVSLLLCICTCARGMGPHVCMCRDVCVCVYGMCPRVQDYGLCACMQHSCRDVCLCVCTCVCRTL